MNTEPVTWWPCFWIPLVALALGCSDSEENGTPPAGTTSVTSTTTTTTSTTDTNLPPEWTDAPSSIQIGQGQSLSVPFSVQDPNGDAFSVGLTVSGGLEAMLVKEQTELVLYVDYHVTGSQSLTVLLEDELGQQASLSVPVEVSELGWQATQTWSGSLGPAAREHGAMIVDDQAGLAVLVGGSGYSPYLDPLDDVWRYDITAGSWTLLTPSGELPAGGGSRRVAQIPGSTIAYLFGGYGVGGSSNQDLYQLDIAGGEASFSVVAQNNPPPPRALHAFVYDPTTERFFLFGGVGTKLYDDTWMMTLDGGTAHWTELSLDPRPTARYGFFYGFDADLGRLVLYSGAQGTVSVNPAHDTWVLDVRADTPTWQQVNDGTDAPTGRRNGCMVFDPTGPRLFVFGGTPDGQITAPGLWVFDARPGKERWVELIRTGEPALRSSGFGFYDAVGQRTLLGFGNTSSSIFRDWTPLGY